jgi:hypothetical protein
MLCRFRLGLPRCLSSVSRNINNNFGTLVFGLRSHYRRIFWFGTDRLGRHSRQRGADQIGRSLFKKVGR